jgi:hypothetical protein
VITNVNTKFDTRTVVENQEHKAEYNVFAENKKKGYTNDGKHDKECEQDKTIPTPKK